MGRSGPKSSRISQLKPSLPLICRQVRLGSVVCSDTLPTYTGIAAKGYVHRLVQHDRGEFRSRHGAHINGLEGFSGYLKRRLAAKGGIRPFRLPLYVVEYVWRYNHRRLSVDEQVHRLMNLLRELLLVARVRLYPFFLVSGYRTALATENQLVGGT